MAATIWITNPAGQHVLRANVVVNGNGTLTGFSPALARDIQELGAQHAGGTAVFRDGSGANEVTLTLSDLALAAPHLVAQRELAPFVPFNARTDYPETDAFTIGVFNSLGPGVNLGNMWDAMGRTDARPGAYRNLFANAYILDAVVKGGFQHIRVPNNWMKRIMVANSPYTVDAAYIAAFVEWLQLVQTFPLKVVTNFHHDYQLCAWANWQSLQGIALDDAKAAAVSAQAQVTAALAQFPATFLLEETHNEPDALAGADAGNPGMTEALWYPHQNNVFAAKRAANNDRIIICTPHTGGTSKLATASWPADARKRRLLTAHPYEPVQDYTHNFTRAEGAHPLYIVRFRTEMLAAVARMRAASDAAGIPITGGEWGEVDWVPKEHRCMYARDFVNACNANGIVHERWALDTEFSTFRRGASAYVQGLMKAITNVEPAPTHDPVAADGNILNLKSGFWASTHAGTNGAGIYGAHEIKPSLSPDGNTLTFPANIEGATTGTRTVRGWWIGTKGRELKPGQRIRVTISGSGADAMRVKLVRGAWEGDKAPRTDYREVLIDPGGPGVHWSVPPWGWIPNGGSVEWDIADTNPSDPSQYEADPFGFEFELPIYASGGPVTLKAVIL